MDPVVPVVTQKPSAVESTCRTCGKISEDGSDLYPMYTSTEYHNELKMVQEEFDIWNLNIAEDDGLPQKICLTCFDSFCQIHNFRIICQEAQMNFGELCTGLDIIIKLNDENINLDEDFPEDFEGDQLITIQEHYQFPGDEQEVVPDPVEDGSIYDHLLDTLASDEEAQKYGNTMQSNEEMEAVISEFKPFQCEYCMDVVSFDDTELLNKHYNIFHSSDEPYPCPKCDKHFNTKVKRNSHARVHFRHTISCPVCKKKIRGGKRMLAQHFELHHNEKKRECLTCGKKFEKITLKRFNYHLSWHDDSKLHKCKFCDKKFIQVTHLAVHEKTHTGECPYLCSQCGLGFKSSNLLHAHLKTHGATEYECPHCPRKFFHRHGLKLHIQTHDRGKKAPYCEICKRSFGSMMNLRLHNHRRHGGPSSPAIINILKKRVKKQIFIKPYKCAQCPEAFVLHIQLLKHLKTHEENRPHKCDRCGRSYKREAHLKLHLNSVHLNNKPHKCTICGWAFSQKNNLTEHIASKHQDKRDFVCDICGKAFAIAKTLRHHKQKHSDKKPYTCNICHKRFTMMGILKSHINTHLKKNEADVAAGDITDVLL